MSNAEHLFMCLVVTCMSSLEKCLFRSFSHYLIELFLFLALSCMRCLYILEINPLSAAEKMLIIRETQIKITMRYHLTVVRMASIKSLQTINAGEGVAKREASFTVGGNVY